MSSIFISHSSEDEGLSRQLARRLEEQNHTSVFLDVDPTKGLVAGQSWERTLYRKLRACRAICVVCTDNYLRSQWCFAELALARMEGKHVFVLKADPLDPVARLPSLLKDTQMVDLRSEPEEGFRRIWRALREEDILGAPGDWSPAESPYLGLSAFQERHAAVFFGREDETRGGVEMLTRGFPPLVLVLGASGSGKSSLVRAGILPRLRRQTDRWIIVEPFRPGSNPLAELAASMEQTHLRYAPRPVEQWRADRVLSALEVVAAGGDEDVPAVRPLLDLAFALRRSEPGRRDARVLLVVDQLEEALGHDVPNHPANRFLALIRGSLQAPDSPLSVLCTLRSDFLGLFQSCPPLRGVNFDSLPLGPMRPGAMRCVIEEPARLAGIELEVGLADRLLEDTETADALPLLSFTLWKLSADASHNGRLEIGGYERFGGIQGALAGEAEAILRAAQREGNQDALRRALLRMVRIRDDGQYARRPIRWDDGEIGAVRPLLEHFVERRLLVSRTDGDVPVVEMAHEALFRSWGPLRAWLDERRTDLLLEAQIRRDAAAWAETGWPVDVLWRGGRLQQAEALVGQGRLSADEHAFVGAGVRLRQRRRRLIASGALVLFALLSGAAVYSLHMAGNARTAARVAIAGNLVSQSREYLGTNHALALLLNAQALHFAPTADVQAGLLGSLEAEPYLLRVSEHADREGVPDQSPYCNERTDDELRASVEGSSDLWSEDRWVACEGIDEEKNHYARVVCRQGASAGPGECRSWETYIFSRRRWNEVPREDAASACRELEVVAGAETWGPLRLRASYDNAEYLVRVRGEGVEYDLPTVDLQGLDLYGLKVDGVAMSPDRRLIATSVAHGRSLSRMSIMLWDAQTRERIGHVYAYPGGWYQGDEYREAANPGGGFILPPGILFVDDRELAFCGEEPVTLDVSPSSWAEKACALANRNLTVSEWDQFVGGAFPYEATCILP